MNVSELDYICKKRSREVFEAAKDSIINNPFIEINNSQGVIDDCIEFEIMQSLGAKILKDFLKNNSVNNSSQMLIVSGKIDYYRNAVVKAFKGFARGCV